MSKEELVDALLEALLEAALEAELGSRIATEPTVHSRAVGHSHGRLHT
jgi:hypothetical protein